MDKQITKGINKAGSLLSATALSLALATSNATCIFMSYQPTEPKTFGKFKTK